MDAVKISIIKRCGLHILNRASISQINYLFAEEKKCEVERGGGKLEKGESGGTDATLETQDLEATLALSINQADSVYVCPLFFKWLLTTFRTEIAGNKTAPLDKTKKFIENKIIRPRKKQTVILTFFKL